MKNSVEYRKELFQLFKQDKTIRKLLKIKNDTAEEWSKKMRRSLQTDDLLDDTIPLFFIYTFIPSIANTYNYLVNKPTMEFTIYGRYQSEIDALYLALIDVLKRNYEDVQVIYEGSFATGSRNLYGYMFRIRPMIWA